MHYLPIFISFPRYLAQLQEVFLILMHYGKALKKKKK